MKIIFAVAACLSLLFISGGSKAQGNCPVNLIPMYEGVIKDEAMLKADEKTLQKFQKIAQQENWTFEQLVEHNVDVGWKYFHKRKDPFAAMKHFNQTWLLDPENGDVYYGMAMMVETLRTMWSLKDCSFSSELSDRLFQISFSKPGTSIMAEVDYGRFLWTQKRLDESLQVLHAALKKDPKVPDARKHIAFVHFLKEDYDKACSWVKRAKENNEIIKKRFLENMCKQED